MLINGDDYQALDKWLDDNVDALYKKQPLAQDWARIA